MITGHIGLFNHLVFVLRSDAGSVRKYADPFQRAVFMGALDLERGFNKHIPESNKKATWRKYFPKVGKPVFNDTGTRIERCVSCEALITAPVAKEAFNGAADVFGGFMKSPWQSEGVKVRYHPKHGIHYLIEFEVISGGIGKNVPTQTQQDFEIGPLAAQY